MVIKRRARKERGREPHRWFAWHPVLTQNHEGEVPETVWMETVERRLVGYGRSWWWEYGSVSDRRLATEAMALAVSKESGR